MSKIKVLTSLAAILVLVSASGCMGRMGLSKKVTGFNLSVSEDRWVREGTFVGLHVVPVYPFTAFLDLMVFNSIEFWTGTNPITDESPLTEESAP